jgi:hypothetical protein
MGLMLLCAARDVRAQTSPAVGAGEPRPSSLLELLTRKRSERPSAAVPAPAVPVERGLERPLEPGIRRRLMSREPWPPAGDADPEISPAPTSAQHASHEQSDSSKSVSAAGATPLVSLRLEGVIQAGVGEDSTDGVHSVVPAAQAVVAAGDEDVVVQRLSHALAPTSALDQPQIARPLFEEALEGTSPPIVVESTGWIQESLEWTDEDGEDDDGWFESARGFWHRDECEECYDNPWRRLFGLGMHRMHDDIGIGRERVALATFEIDASQPFSNVRARYDAAYGLDTPDRAEWFWAKSGKGPVSGGERVNYQDLRFYSEVGGKSFSAIVDLPLRSLDPEINGNTTGFGDMVAGTKTVMVDGRYWQITQVFRTYINTGSVKKGLGTGHVALEPGVLARYKWTDDTYIHGELKYLFPVGADPKFAGQVLRYGIGLTQLCYDTDTFALIHSAELSFMTFEDGQKTTVAGTRDVDGETVGTGLYGLRCVLGPAGDLGLFEVGAAGGVGMGTNWIEGLLRLEARWSY